MIEPETPKAESVILTPVKAEIPVFSTVNVYSIVSPSSIIEFAFASTGVAADLI